jgi:tight adherence protein B
MLPIAVAAVIGFTNPDYLKPLWLDRYGKFMVAAAVVMQIAGMLAIRKIVRIKI